LAYVYHLGPLGLAIIFLNPAQTAAAQLTKNAKRLCLRYEENRKCAEEDAFYPHAQLSVFSEY